MKVVTIRSDVIQAYKVDAEMLQKANRPCALIVNLKYKGKRQTFAIPLRSNISASAPKETYFPLPPRPTTRPGNRHGVHYIKMFPIKKTDAIRFRIEGNVFAALIKGILDKNEKTIIESCQNYLYDYEKGVRHMFCTDIDLLLSLMN